MGLSLTLSSRVPAEPARATAPTSTAPDAFDDLLVVRVEMEGGEQVAQQLRPQILVALRDAKVDEKLLTSAPLEVAITRDPNNPGAYRVVFVHQGEQVNGTSCACSGDELVNHLQRTTIDVWKSLMAMADTGAAAVEVPTVALETAPTPALAHDDAKARRLWISGLAIIPLGAGAIAGSTAILIIDAVGGRSVSPTALGIFGAGVAVTSVAVPMWAVGRKRLQLSRVGLAPAGRGLVISVGARF